MNKQTLKALEGSIKKWEDIAYHGGIDYSNLNCPLCILVRRTIDCDCGRCVVGLKTGKQSCHGSPYEKWIKHFLKCHSWRLEHKVQCKTCKKIAIEELNFLKSLLLKDTSIC